MVRSIGLLGVRTEAFDRTVALYRDVLRMKPILQRPGAAWFRATDGAQIHAYGPTDEDHGFFDAGPVVGLVVEDFDAGRAAMVAARVEFIGEPRRDGGSAWNDDRGPDGNVYEIIGHDREAR